MVSLAALNGSLLSNTLWFTPPGVDATGNFATLGATTPEGDFTRVSQFEVQKLDGLGFGGQWALYANSDVPVSIDAKDMGVVGVAIVSANFFELLGVKVTVGEALSEARDGLVLGSSFWRAKLGADPSVIGRSIKVGKVSLPVIGIADAGFRGPDRSDPAIYVASRHFTAIEEIGIPVPDSSLEQFAQQLPAFNAFVRLPNNGSSESLSNAWSVRSNDSITFDLPATPENPRPTMTLGFSAVGFKPGIASGIDLQPATSAVVLRYVLLLTVLSAVLIVLAAVNLWAYWSSRASDRVQEFQVRVAVGATPPDLLAQFAAECAPLILAVAALSVPLAHLQFQALLKLEPFASYFSQRVDQLQLSSFIPSLLVVAAMAVVAIAAPFLTMRRSVLRSQSIGLNKTLTRSRLLILFVQWFFIGLVLLIATDSLRRNAELKSATWGGTQRPFAVKFFSTAERDALMASLRVSEGQASTLLTRPLDRLQAKQDYYLPGAVIGTARPTIYSNYGSPNFHKVLGVPILAGVMFDATSPYELVVSQSVATSFGLAPHQMVGQTINQVSMSNSDGKDIGFRVVGVVGDVHYSSLRTAPELVSYRADLQPSSGSLLIPLGYGVRLAGAAAEMRAHMPDLAERTASALAMDAIRDKSAETETALSAATFLYSLVAMFLLGLGVVAEANILLNQRSRELALKVAVGWSTWHAGHSIVRVPVLIAVAALSLALLVGWVSSTDSNHWLSIPAFIVALALFLAAFLLFIRIRLHRASLAALLRQA